MSPLLSHVSRLSNMRAKHFEPTKMYWRQKAILPHSSGSSSSLFVFHFAGSEVTGVGGGEKSPVTYSNHKVPDAMCEQIWVAIKSCHHISGIVCMTNTAGSGSPVQILAESQLWVCPLITQFGDIDFMSCSFWKWKPTKPTIWLASMCVQKSLHWWVFADGRALQLHWANVRWHESGFSLVMVVLVIVWV